MSFACFINALNSSVTSNGTGIRTLNRNQLIEKLKQGGMSEMEIDKTIELMNDVYKSVVKDVSARGHINKKQRALLNVVYGNGIGSLSANNMAAMEAAAEIMEVPFISAAEMKTLKDLAVKSDTREGSEKEYVEDEIRSILDQKQDDYYTRLASSKVAFKVLLSVGFTLRAAISNKKKRFEMLLVEKMKLASEQKGVGNKVKSFFSAYPLHDFAHFNREHAAASRSAVRGKKFGFGSERALLSPSAPYAADLGTRSDQLEFANERELAGTVKGWLRRADRQIAKLGKRWTAGIDASAKVRMGDYFYFTQLRRKVKRANPAFTEAEVMKAVHDEMFAIPKNQAIQIAIDQFKDWGVELDSQGEPKQNSPRFKVRVAEIMKSKRDPEMMAAAYQQASSKVWQGKMTYFQGTFREKIDSGLGGMIADVLNGMRRVAQGIVEKSFSSTTSKTIGQSVIFNTFGFINGAAAYWQDFMEHNMIYAALKIGRLNYLKKGYKKSGKLTPEDMEYLEDKIIEMHGKFLYAAVETAAVFALSAMAKNLCSEGPQGSINPDKPTGEDAVLANTQQQRGESSITFCDTVNIPFEYLGGFSFANVKLISSLFNAIENKDENYMSAFATSMWLTSSPSISPLMDKNPGPATRIWDVFQTSVREGQGYVKVANVAQKELSYAGADIVMKLLPVPNRLMKEATLPVIPYRQYQPAGIGVTEGTADMFVQFGRQFAYNMGNISGVNQMAAMFTNESDGLIGRPLFDYRHRPIDAGNMYDGTSLASLSQPFRALYERGKGKDPILYDEVDHFLNMHDVAIPWDSRTYTTLHKDTDKQRLLTDDEYYNYMYAYTKKFGDWVEKNYPRLQDKAQVNESDPAQYEVARNKAAKEVRNKVRAELLEIKKRVIKTIEQNGKLEGEEIYQRIK